MTSEDRHTVADAPEVDRDALSASFDEEPGHGLRGPAVRAAWAAAAPLAATGPADVLDPGCGTGQRVTPRSRSGAAGDGRRGPGLRAGR